MSKHTPGPWEVYSYLGNRVTIINNQGNDLVEINPLKDKGEREDNAFLISAAPELLERLEITNTAIQAGIDANVFTPGARMTLEAVMKYNKQAIAKAEGTQ